jgi:anti-sigma factor RsiW
MNEAPHDHKQCRSLFAKLSEYLDNELDAATARTIRDHLEQCKPCQVCLETLKRTVQFCRLTGDDPVPERLSRKLRQFISKYQPPEA